MNNDGAPGPGDGRGDEGGAGRLRILAALSASLASRDPADLRRTLLAARGLLTGEEVEEVILQSYLFLGYPVALNAFGLWRRLSADETPGETGPGAGDAPRGREPGAWEGWRVRGEAVCRAVYGGQYEDLRENIRALHPDMERWMVVEGYGKVLGRPGLGLAVRELCISALLAVLRTPRQLYSHLRGALNTGATPEQVEAALAQAFLRLDEEGRLEANEVWSRVRARNVAGGHPAADGS